MLISLQTLLDIIFSSLKRLYQTELKIISIEKTLKRVQIFLQSEDDKTRKYDVEIWLNYDESHNEFEIRSVELSLLIKNDGFPTYIGEWTCSNLYEFNKATSTLLKDMRFKAQEMEF